MYLITGASGFIGRYLVKRMQGKGEKLRLLVRSNKIDNFKKDASTEFFTGDLVKPETLIKATKDIDVVIHLAAISYTLNKKLYSQVNTQGTKNLVRACEKNKVKRIIYISTRDVSPSGGFYSRSKLEAEEIVKSSFANFTILRLAEVYGGNKGKGVEHLIGMIRKLPFIPIIGKGDYSLQPVYVEDVAGAIISVSESNRTNGKTYNIAGPDAFTYNDLVRLICEKLNLRRCMVHLPVKVALLGAYTSCFFLKRIIVCPDQILRLISAKAASIERAVEDFGYNPLNFEKGLKLVLNPDNENINR